MPVATSASTMQIANALTGQSIDEIWARVQRDVPLECIEACALCEFACLACAEACLSGVELERLGTCVRLSLDCAEMCLATRTLVAEGILIAPKIVHVQLMVCARLCATCEAECRRLGVPRDFFSMCARACAHCETLCLETRERVQNLH